MLDFATSRPYTLIMLLALFCTLLAKLVYAKRSFNLAQYPGWILSDIAFLLGIEVVFAFLCFSVRKLWIVRLCTILSAFVCLWSFLNAGWLVRTGTQILPHVFSPMLRAPLSYVRLVSRNVYKMPVTGFILLLPGAFALLFLFYALARTRLPNYNKKRFFIRFNASIIICLAVLAVRPELLNDNRASRPASLELRYNTQFKAVAMLFSKRYKPPPEPIRRVPFYDQLKVVQGPEMTKENIVVIVLEGVQYERTSFSGNNGDLTPFLVSLAASGAKFTNARSTLTHTTKALFALMTGRYASASQDIVEAVPIKKPYASLATILRGQLGYRSGFFQSARGYFEGRPGLAHNLGFDKFCAIENLNDPNCYLSYLGGDEFSLIEPIAKWIKSDSKPFLLTIMCSATHDKYEVPEWFGQQAKEDIDRYKQTIAYTDKFLSAFYEELSRLGIIDNTIFCVIGDHGEAFNEHGFSGHERIVFDEALHVPFCLKAPSIEPGKIVSKPVSSIDLTPTLLALLGFDVKKAGFDGINVLGPINDERKVYFSSWMYESPAGFIQGNTKYVYDLVHQTTCYYNLETDPYELKQKYVPEDEKQAFIDEIETWRENTIFQYDQDYKGKDIFYGHWLCKWGNRYSTAKYVSTEEAIEFARKNKK